MAILAVNTEGLRSDNVTAEVATPPVGPPQVPDQPTIGVITENSAIVNWEEAGEHYLDWGAIATVKLNSYSPFS